MKKFRRSILIAVCIYFIDAIVFNQGVIAVIIGIGAVLGGGIMALIALMMKNRSLSKERIIRAGIYLSMAVLVVVSNKLNNRLAYNRANQLIQACNSYNSQYQKYPEKLVDLVPNYMPDVPHAKFTLRYNRFMYISGEEQHLLVYYVMPPFGRRAYNLEEERWYYFD